MLLPFVVVELCITQRYCQAWNDYGGGIVVAEQLVVKTDKANYNDIDLSSGNGQ